MILVGNRIKSSLNVKNNAHLKQSTAVNSVLSSEIIFDKNEININNTMYLNIICTKAGTRNVLKLYRF